MTSPRSFLIIQTAFTGDVILATALIEKLHTIFPDASIDFLLRKGNESLLTGHPYVREVLVWDKKQSKLRNLGRMIHRVRAKKYSVVINVHRFASSGIITVLSAAERTIGFNKNPLSFLFSKRVAHVIDNGVHEVQRNQLLIASFTNVDNTAAPRPRLYPQASDRSTVEQHAADKRAYCCVAPTSVWFTKQFPEEKWLELLATPWMQSRKVFLLGAPSDFSTADLLREKSNHSDIVNLAGKLSYLESAALMEGAVMNFVNDSAPMHLASSVNAPVTAVYCSTVPSFGFGPLSDNKTIVETTIPLACRPCGLHGHRACPEGHFKCALTITPDQVLAGA